MFAAHQLSYQRADRDLFSKLSFSILEGQVLHIKGENGAGKSSLLKLLTGTTKADEGQITWQDNCISKDAHHFNSNLLFIGHRSGINHHLSAEENLAWYASLAGQNLSNSESNNIYKKMGLYGFEDIPSGKLSAGQQRRIALCRLLVEKKKLWILDEPLVSLDQQGVLLFEALLQAHVEQGGLAILTSHQDIQLSDKNIQRLDLKQFKNFSLNSESKSAA